VFGLSCFLFPISYFFPIIQGDEVLGSGGVVHLGHKRDGRSGEVHRHGNAVFFGIVTDFLGLQDTARAGQIGMNDIRPAPPFTSCAP